jgi:hypothetical protein
MPDVGTNEAGNLHCSRLHDVQAIPIAAFLEYFLAGRESLRLRHLAQRFQFGGRQVYEQFAGFEGDHNPTLEKTAAR